MNSNPGPQTTVGQREAGAKRHSQLNALLQQKEHLTGLIHEKTKELAALSEQATDVQKRFDELIVKVAPDVLIPIKEPSLFGKKTDDSATKIAKAIKAKLKNDPDLLDKLRKLNVLPDMEF